MKNYTKYATSILFFIGVLILVIIGFNLIRNILKNDDSPKEKQTETSKKIGLLEAGEQGKTVQYTVHGSVVGEDQRRGIRITVNPNTRRIDVLQGYNDQIINTQETTNTPEAYKAFIAAINGAGFSSNILAENRGSKDQSCPLGRTFDYEIAPGDTDSLRTWSNTCSRKTGTFTGNANLIRTLFQKQIPDYDKFVTDVRLN